MSVMSVSLDPGEPGDPVRAGGHLEGVESADLRCVEATTSLPHSSYGNPRASAKLADQLAAAGAQLGLEAAGLVVIPACTTPELCPVWWAARWSSFSKTSTCMPGKRRVSSARWRVRGCRRRRCRQGAAHELLFLCSRLARGRSFPRVWPGRRCPRQLAQRGRDGGRGLPVDPRGDRPSEMPPTRATTTESSPRAGSRVVTRLAAGPGRERPTGGAGVAVRRRRGPHSEALVGRDFGDNEHLIV